MSVMMPAWVEAIVGTSATGADQQPLFVIGEFGMNESSSGNRRVTDIGARMGIGALRYRAFISYSHRDADIARWLHRNLENYRVPSRLRGSVGEFGPLPDRLTPIFLDREDLSSAGELGPRIRAALADSEALIVICSRDAARSPWTNEEVLSFKRLGRSDRIYCLIVDGEPGDAEAECFPPALRFDLDKHGDIGTHIAEPLAADVRAGKDGKALARLKILSGVLGVPLDRLRQREAARRHRRMLAITALAVLVTLVTSFLAVQAVVQRDAALRRQKQAEDLVGFMLGDLTDRLSQVSRLDILEHVDDKAMDYFKSLPNTDVTDQALEHRAKALVNIGNVRRDQGDLSKALESFEAAAVLASRLARAAPDDAKRQMAYVDVLTYLGTVHWYQGDLDNAQKSFETARMLLQQTQARTSRQPELVSILIFQRIGIDNNIGHVLEAQGHLDEAMLEYQGMLAASKQLVAMETGDSKQAHWETMLGLAHNNLAKMALLHGDLRTAVAEYRADLDIEIKLSRGDPRDNAQAEKVLISQATLGRTLALTGDVAAGISQMRQALDQVKRLLGFETNSTEYQEDEALYSSQLARLLRLDGDLAGARALSSRSLSILDKLTRQDPANVGWQRELAETRVEQAEQSRASGDLGAAREQVLSALAILKPQLTKQANDRGTVLATTAARLLLAAVTADAGSAIELREEALQTIQSQRSGLADPRLRALLVEALFKLGRDTDALPIWQSLWRDGFRDPGFLALLRSEKVLPPTTATPVAKQPPEGTANRQ